ncbi:ROK family transcriptional regulator [Microbacterium sp. YY-01]|uniref:ROK family transcriptional regulator n=1 Tax=Microbacterium sp. YY-01 TaxID=3421634 RepID=UPI003D166B92
MADRGGTFDGVHRRNLSRIVRLVHREGPQSRAALTAATGLNRSTVGSLVAELVEGGLVEEQAPGPARRAGRPSPMVALRHDIAVIAVNPEIDAIEIAAVTWTATVLLRERVLVDSVPTPDAAVDVISSVIRRWQAHELASVRLLGVGVAVPGLVRAADGLVRLAPHLMWRESPFAERVAEAVRLPTFVGNDATLGAHAEHIFGVARGVGDVVYVNGGASGIGGGLIIGGTVVMGAGGYAGEFGQNRPGFMRDDDRRTEGGVVEDEVNRARLLDIVGLHAADDVALSEALRDKQHEPRVADEIARQRRIVATTLANAVNVLNPSMIVLAGFLATLAEHDPDALRQAIAAHAMPAAVDDVCLEVAALGSNRLMIGAAELALEPFVAAPDRAW